ncbi:hypothetical protein [Siminovitchia fortis]|nr:hypothetical protein [Siminovitchia fortis]WHY82698.1 hypothetical protein QNH23_04755 [Siminovitchia fortis]
MGCCSPEYRKVVNEKEEKVNEKGRESLPPYVKILSVVITAGAVAIAVIL